MRKTVDANVERLEQVTAQLEQAARRNQGGGIMGALKPFLLGALAGAGLALLYAPQRGEQTRAMLRRNATDLQDRATQTASSVKEQLPVQATAAQDKARTLLDQTKQQVKTAAGRGQDTPQSANPAAKEELGADASTAKKQAVDGSRGAHAQAQLRRDLETGRENPA